MRYYWEVLFNAEYFPYWEFTMLMMLVLQLSQLWRLNRMEKKLDEITGKNRKGTINYG
jgi:hypothetical protein